MPLQVSNSKNCLVPGDTHEVYILLAGPDCVRNLPSETSPCTDPATRFKRERECSRHFRCYVGGCISPLECNQDIGCYCRLRSRRPKALRDRCSLLPRCIEVVSLAFSEFPCYPLSLIADVPELGGRADAGSDLVASFNITMTVENTHQSPRREQCYQL